MRRTRLSTHRTNRRSKIVTKLPGRSVSYETKNCPHCDHSTKKMTATTPRKHDKNNVVRHYAEDNKENHTRVINVAAKKFRNSQELIDNLYPTDSSDQSNTGRNKRNSPSERRRSGRKSDKTGEDKIKLWMMQTFPKLFETPLKNSKYGLRNNSKFSNHLGPPVEGFKGFDNVWYPSKIILLGFLIHDLEGKLSGE